MSYYHLKSSTMNPCDVEVGEYDQACRTWLCQACGLPRPGTGAVDLTLIDPPENVPLNIVNGVGIGVIRDDLAEALGQSQVKESLGLGRLHGPDGKPLRGFSTFRGKRMLIIRGDKRSSSRRCDQCGRVVYFPMGKHHLVGKPSQTVSIFESQFNQLVVDESICERIKGRRWKKLTIDRLEVVQAPIDGADLNGEVEN